MAIIHLWGGFRKPRKELSTEYSTCEEGVTSGGAKNLVNLAFAIRVLFLAND